MTQSGHLSRETDFSSTAVMPGWELLLSMKCNQILIKKYILHRGNRRERRTGEAHRDKYSFGTCKDRPVTVCKLRDNWISEQDLTNLNLQQNPNQIPQSPLSFSLVVFAKLKQQDSVNRAQRGEIGTQVCSCQICCQIQPSQFLPPCLCFSAQTAGTHHVL